MRWIYESLEYPRLKHVSSSRSELFPVFYSRASAVRCDWTRSISCQGFEDPRFQQIEKRTMQFEFETAGSFKLPDGTLVPKGSHLEGRVISSKARSKGDSDSELTLAFDKLDIANGKQLSIKGTVQAVFPPAEESMGPTWRWPYVSRGKRCGCGARAA